MSKKDSYITDEIRLHVWDGHEDIHFRSSAEMLEWVNADKTKFSLSDKVYTAMIYGLENGIDEIEVATLTVAGESQVSVIIRKPNFQKILTAYTEKLLGVEDYERLSRIKEEVSRFGLEVS